MILLKQTFKKLTLAVCATLFIFTASSFAWGQTIIALQDFETTPATPTLTFSNSGTGGFSTGTNGSGLPANANLFAGGARGWQVVGGTSTLTFANQSLSGFTNPYVEFRLAAMSLTTGNGVDTNDTATIAISVDGGTTYSDELTVSGSAANQRWDFTATGSITITYDGNNSPTAVPSSSGAGGISTVRVDIPAVQTQVRIRITLLNNSTDERWVIDNVSVRGTAGNGNVAPVISDIPDAQTTAPNTPKAINFTVTDTNATCNDVTGVSNNQAVVADSGITITGGATANCTVTVTPVANVTSGTAQITLTATDTDPSPLTDTETFNLTIVVPSPIVINEVYGGSGSANPSFNADFIELYNNGSTPFNLNGYSLQYSAAAFGGYTFVIALPNASIPANGYFLVRTTTPGSSGAALPTPNFISATAVDMAGANGNVILVNGTTALGATCPAVNAANILDRVAYGTGTCREGATSAPAGSAITSPQRTTVGVDTDVNGNDFTSTTPTPTSSVATPGTLSFSSATYQVTEGAGTATITVTRTGGTDGAVSANYATSNGTATSGLCGASGIDYQAASGTVNFAAGSATSQTFNVTICADAIYEDAETVNLTLSNPTGGATIGTSAATLTINDNNTPPVFSIDNVSANEGNSGLTSFTFTISKTGATALSSSITYQTADGTATAGEDYIAVPATALTFLPGESAKLITVFVNGDTTPEPNETFFVNLSNAVGGTISATNGSATGTIINDEPSIATLAAPQNCVGLAPSPLTAGATNRALLCFALSSNTNANFTALNVPFTTDPSVRFSNPRLISSTDADYTTTADNILIATGTVTANQFTFSGFSAFADAGEGGFPSLTATPTNFFVVADVLLSVNASTPSSQPSVSTTDVTVSNGTVTGTTATGQNYTFDLAPTAADGMISGRVTNTNHRGLENVTVTLSGGSLVQPIVVYTNSVGRFRFTEIPTGEIYTITVESKRHRFDQPSTALSLTGTSDNINFVGEGW